MWKLYLDDLRDPPDDSWIVARSYNEAVQLVNQNGFPSQVDFDHDLGIGETGLDFALFLVETDIEGQVNRIQRPDILEECVMPADFTFTVHSKNPVGAENIRELLSRYVQWRQEESDELD